MNRKVEEVVMKLKTSKTGFNKKDLKNSYGLSEKEYNHVVIGVMNEIKEGSMSYLTDEKRAEKMRNE